MSVDEEREATAEALYTAIREKVNEIDQYSSGQISLLETLARAYSLVAAQGPEEPMPSIH